MYTILVVDDGAVDRRIAGGCVEELGHEAIYAEDGKEALAVIARAKPDIVLTDLQMPEINGLELVERVCQEHPGLPVMLMTAYGSEEIAVAALKAGAASYVPKSMLKQELTDALQVVLSAVEVKHHREEVRDYLQQSESHFVFGHEPSATASLISHLQGGLEQVNFCSETTLFQITTALGEAFTNAIDHGSLELDSALRERTDNAYRRTGNERSKQAPYCDRRVHVMARLTPDEATYIIQDEGPGFDPSQLPDPTDPANLLKASGRGLMLIKTFMDEVSFNDKANEITMVKRRV